MEEAKEQITVFVEKLRPSMAIGPIVVEWLDFKEKSQEEQ